MASISTTSQRLKEIMALRNLRQTDILDMCKPFSKEYGVSISKSDLSQYVNGKVIPGQFKLTILAMALNVTETWLLGLDSPRISALSEFEFRLLKASRAADPIYQNVALEILECHPLKKNHAAHP